MTLRPLERLEALVDELRARVSALDGEVSDDQLVILLDRVRRSRRVLDRIESDLRIKRARRMGADERGAM